MKSSVILSLEPAPSIALRADSKSGYALIGTRQERFYHRNNLPSKPQSRNQRCFNQFDRKTDCFDGGCEGSSKAPPSKGEDVRYSSAATAKTVCLTQTRHDGSVNKYQPDSQIMALLSGNGLLSIRTGRPIRAAIWQKPGIDVAVVKSSRTQRYNDFRPDRTALRKTSSGWLPADMKTKDHAGFVLMDIRNVRASF